MIFKTLGAGLLGLCLCVNATALITAARAEEQAFSVANYFVAENATLSVETEGLAITTSNNDNVTSFYKAIPEDFVSVNFFTVDGKTNFGGVTFTLADGMDESKYVTVSYRPSVINQNYTVIRVNEESEVKTLSSLKGANAVEFGLTYDASKHEISSLTGSKYGEIESFVDGTEFNGFPSGTVKLSVSMTDVTGDSAIQIITLAGQSMSSSTTKDNQGPRISLSNELPLLSYVNIGEEFILPSASAYDVFGEVTSLAVSVKFDGEVVYSGDALSEQSLTFNEDGRYYVEYVSADALGNIGNFSCVVMAKVGEAPDVAIANEIEYATVGQQYTPQKAVVSDENATVFIYIQGENGRVYYVKENGTFTFKTAGTYKVFYYVYDAYQNIALEYYTVEVR